MTEAALVVAAQGSPSSPLVFVSFQKNEQRKFKFLEGEPKALGITQICLSVFHSSCVASLFAAGMLKTGLEIPSFVCSLLAFIAGSVAIAAKNLHLPTLRACLGMVAVVVSLFNVIITLINMTVYWSIVRDCYYYDEGQMKQICYNAEAAHTHLFAELTITQVAQFGISVTLVVYAAKVAHCCAPAPNVPVITIQAPPAPQ
uniref:Membrane-spanning 4-domains subfamily A member 4A n=1 Tax=Neogobius melanostomus TaxID=47308 RepID=A0A8C6TGZ3_9GOBI